MQDKMQAHFTQRLHESECQSEEILNDVDQLVKDIRETRASLVQENASLE